MFKAAFALGALAQSSGALQEGFLKHLGDVVTVLLDLVRLSLFSFFMCFQTLDHDQIWGLVYKMLRRNHPKFDLTIISQICGRVILRFIE